MEKNGSISKILIIGGSGYLGSYMVKASLKLGHPTYVFTRPNSSKVHLINEFKSMGAIIVKGKLEEHEKLVAVLKEVDVVISVLAFPQVLDQFKILEAIKVAGNIKRFVPSDFGVEEDRVRGLPPFEAVLEKKRKIRRAIEEAMIPYTFIAANCLASYFINHLLNPNKEEEINVYGTGQATFVMNYEEDIGIYTIKAATDPRTCNRRVTCMPSTNIITQLELISKWEKKTGKDFKKFHVSEEEVVALSESLPYPDNIRACILHAIFVKGMTARYDFEDNEVEASTLYPDVELTTVDELLELFVHERPELVSTEF